MQATRREDGNFRRAPGSGAGREKLAQLGFDNATLERALAAERAESRRHLEKLKADAVADPLHGRSPCNAW